MDRPGPSSLVWQRMADDRGLLLGGATLVLQVADRTVGAGVAQHSNFKQEPWRRLWGTLTSLVTIVYGTTEQAGREVERLRAMHRPIRGVDESGQTYAALRPAPWAWVHGTLAWSVIRLNELFGTPFSEAECEQYWREWLQVGALLGVRDGDLPATWAEFRGSRRGGGRAGRQRVGARRCRVGVADPAAVLAALDRPGVAGLGWPAGRRAVPVGDDRCAAARARGPARPVADRARAAQAAPVHRAGRRAASLRAAAAAARPDGASDPVAVPAPLGRAGSVRAVSERRRVVASSREAQLMAAMSARAKSRVAQ